MTKRLIVTFSRRTDAGLWVDFLLDKVHRGGTYVPNPMTGKRYWVSLVPDHVALLNLWTKAPNLLLRDLDVLKDIYELAFFVTQTGYAGTWLEPDVPRVEIVTDAITKIVNATGGSLSRMWWRYDTIVTTDRQSEERHGAAVDRDLDWLNNGSARKSKANRGVECCSKQGADDMWLGT